MGESVFEARRWIGTFQHTAVILQGFAGAPGLCNSTRARSGTDNACSTSSSSNVGRGRGGTVQRRRRRGQRRTVIGVHKIRSVLCTLHCLRLLRARFILTACTTLLPFLLGFSFFHFGGETVLILFFFTPKTKSPSRCGDHILLLALAPLVFVYFCDRTVHERGPLTKKQLSLNSSLRILFFS